MSATHSTAPGANPAPLGRFLRISDVIQETSLSRATIYRLIAAGTFPSPIRVGVQRVAWSDGAVQSWKIQQASIANR